MNQWINLDQLASWQKVAQAQHVNLTQEMSGEKGLQRVKQYKVPMAAGLTFSYAAKQVDDTILKALGRRMRPAEGLKKRL